MEGKFVFTNGYFLKRCVPCWQWRKTVLYLLSQMLRRLNIAMSMCRKLKFLQNLAVNLEKCRAVVYHKFQFQQQNSDTPCLPFCKIGLPQVCLYARRLRWLYTGQFVLGLDPPSRAISISTKTSEWPNARFALMIDNVISIILVFRGAIIIDHSR